MDWGAAKWKQMQTEIFSWKDLFSCSSYSSFWCNSMNVLLIMFEGWEAFIFISWGNIFRHVAHIAPALSTCVSLMNPFLAGLWTLSHTWSVQYWIHSYLNLYIGTCCGMVQVSHYQKLNGTYQTFKKLYPRKKIYIITLLQLLRTPVQRLINTNVLSTNYMAATQCIGSHTHCEDEPLKFKLVVV